MKRFAVLILMILAVQLFAQDKPKPVPVSMAIENKILKAENTLDKITQAEQAINVQFMDLQNKAAALQKQYTEEQGKEPAARKAVEEATEEAWKESGLDKTKFDWDAADFTFKPKVEQKAKVEPPAPAKK